MYFAEKKRDSFVPCFRTNLFNPNTIREAIAGLVTYSGTRELDIIMYIIRLDINFDGGIVYFLITLTTTTAPTIINTGSKIGEFILVAKLENRSVIFCGAVSIFSRFLAIETATFLTSLAINSLTSFLFF